MTTRPSFFASATSFASCAKAIRGRQRKKAATAINMRIPSPSLPALRPFVKLFQPETLERVSERPAAALVAAGQAIVLENQIGQPLRDRESLIFAVGDRLQKSRADVLPVVVGNPAALRREDALEQHAAEARRERVVHREIPTGDGVQRIDDAVEAVGLMVRQREPAAAEDAGELPVLLGEHVRARPAVGARVFERTPFFLVAEIRRRLRRSAALWLHTAGSNQLAQHLAELRPPCGFIPPEAT